MTPRRMYVWRLLSDFVAVAQASSVAEARRLVLAEISIKSNTNPICIRARRLVTENTPTIWNYANAEFTITNSAELRLADEALEEQRKEIEHLKKSRGPAELTQTVPYPRAQEMQCECPGCSEEHSENEKCTDLREVVMGVVGGALLAVCKECAVELARKMFA